MTNRVVVLCLALLALSSCTSDGGGDDASIADAWTPSDTGPTPCTAGTNEHSRECPCLDGGLLAVVACSPLAGRCYAYSATCSDPGYTRCNSSAPDDVSAMCRAFCDEHAEESWAGGCGLLP